MRREPRAEFKAVIPPKLYYPSQKLQDIVAEMINNETMFLHPFNEHGYMCSKNISCDICEYNIHKRESNRWYDQRTTPSACVERTEKVVEYFKRTHKNSWLFL